MDRVPEAAEHEPLDEQEGEPQVDPHYLDLLRGTRLPDAYLPAAMAGPQKPWIRVAALALIAVFLLATTAGVCLTYGVHPFSL